MLDEQLATMQNGETKQFFAADYPILSGYDGLLTLHKRNDSVASATMVYATPEGTVITAHKEYFEKWFPWTLNNPPYYGDTVYLTDKWYNGHQVYEKIGLDNVRYWSNSVINGEIKWKTYAQQMGAAPAGFGYGDTLIDARVIGDEDGSVFETKLEEILTAMPTFSAKQVSFHSYPAYSGYPGCGRLAKSENNNQATFVGVDSLGNRFQKIKKDGVWTPLEWINPPMRPGKEYRTTERYDGKPVYVQTIKVEPLAVGSTSSTAQKYFHFGYDIADVISHSGQYVFKEENVLRHYSLPFVNYQDIAIVSHAVNIDRNSNQGYGFVYTKLEPPEGAFAIITVKYTKVDIEGYNNENY